MSDSIKKALEDSSRLMAEGDYEEALVLVSETVQANPDHPLLLWRQADLFDRTRALTAAVSAALKAVKASEGDERIGAFALKLVRDSPPESGAAEAFHSVVDRLPVSSHTQAWKRAIDRQLRTQAILAGDETVQIYEVAETRRTSATGGHIGAMELVPRVRLSRGEAQLGPPWIIGATSRDTDCVFLIESSDKGAAAEAPFVHQAVAASAVRVADLGRSNLDLSRWPSPRHIRYVFSPGRCGSTLLTKLLHRAGIPALSEPAIPFHLASPPGAPTHHHISDREGALLSAAAIGSHFDHPEPDVVVKLNSSANRRPAVLMRPEDDAMFLWRDALDWFSSMYRAFDDTPSVAVRKLDRAIGTYAFLADTRRLSGTIWFEDLVGPTFEHLTGVFSDMIPESSFSVFVNDSQAGTGVAKDVIATKPAPDRTVVDAFRDELGRSAMRGVAADFGLERLFVDARPPLARRKVQARREQGKRVAVVPVPHWGSVEHYYHFLLGYLLPFISVSARDRHAQGFAVRDCGPMNVHYASLSGWDLRVLSRDELFGLAGEPETLSPLGFDHISRYRDDHLRRAIESFIDVQGIRETAQIRGSLLLIERGLPDPFYETPDSEVKSAGVQRRSIPNMDEIEAALSPEWDVRRLSLEGVGLREQAQAFRSADIVVAQHGAALSNLVWCTPKTQIIEIDPQRGNPVFGALARQLGVPYQRVIQDSAHSPVDPQLVVSALQAAWRADRW